VGTVDDARDEIGAALADPAAGGPQTALRVLGLALRWSAAAVRGVEGGPGGSTALAALYALDDALEEIGPLAAALPGLLAAASPGEQVGGGTKELLERLAGAAEQVAAERARLEELTAGEEELRARLAEHDALRRQADELRRLERLVLALDALAEQQQVIADRLAALRGRDAGVEEALRTSGDALVRLSEDQLAVLGPQTRQVLERAAAAQGALSAQVREHARQTAELAAYQDRLERIRAEHGARLASLRRYAAADRDLSRALGTEDASLARVEEYAAGVEAQLREADRVLADLLAEREAADTDGKVMMQRTG
jgi:chromosome segregation ATPase